MKKDEQKTNAIRFLEQKKIDFKIHTYSQEEAISGVEVAEVLGQNPDMVFKTLVTAGKSGNHYVFMIPVAKELDLKKAAKAVGEKSVEMIHVAEINKLTGYIRGGCSPVGMKKQFVTVADASAENLPYFYVSGGRIGLQVKLSPADLAKLISMRFADIVFHG